MLAVLDAAALRHWADVSVDLLDDCRAELDRINVFPVPDSDTGTNLLLTVRSAADAMARRTGREVGPAEAAAVLADGALRGARGNSGVLISQLYRGLAEAITERRPRGGLDAHALAEGLRRADELARAAVSRPVEGTLLSVLRGSAASAERAAREPRARLARVAEAAVRGGRDALGDTPRQLPVLARAGVVDAGGYGLVLLLRALVAVVAERPVRAPEPVEALAALGVGGHAPGRDREALLGEREAGSTRFEYEVMYLLTGSAPERVERLRHRLDALGDSVAVVGSGSGGARPGAGPDTDEVWHVHVHCTDVGAAIEAGIAAGRPRRVTVVRFLDQLGGDATTEGGRFARARSVLALLDTTAGAELLAADGVSVLVHPRGRPPGASRIAAAVAGTRARHVVLLPNDPELTAAAEEAAELAWAAGQEAVVVPTSSVLQGLAALAVHDPARRAGDDVVAMAEAAAATRTGVVRMATTEALTWVGRCQAGDVLGLVDGEVVLIEHDLALACRRLAERMLDTGGELVTVLLGADAPEGVGEMLEGHLRRTHPEVDVVVYRGGPAGQPIALGVE